MLDGVPPVIAASTLRISDLSRPDLRTQEVAEAASEVAANPQVRAALVAFQKDFARREGGAVLDGRDIGTVICPEAEAKLFVTASAEIRAHRRWLELTQAGHDADEAQVLADVKARDARDAGRADAPMKQAPDAILLDTSDMSIDAALETALAHVRDRKERHV